MAFLQKDRASGLAYLRVQDKLNPVENIRITCRSTQGVTVFKVDDSENVVSAAWLIQEDEDDETLAEGDEFSDVQKDDDA